MLKSPFHVGTPAQVYIPSGQLRICGISFMLSHPSDVASSGSLPYVCHQIAQ